MTAPPRLSPHGTARARFAALGHDRPVGDNTSSFFARIAAGMRRHDVDDDTLALAEELVRLQWSLTDDERQALALAVLASIISVGKGSTRLPLAGGVDGHLGRLVSTLLRAAELDLTPATAIAKIKRLASSMTLDRIIGGAGEYRPLIASDGCLYQHRLLRCEDRLAERVRSHLANSAVDGSVDLGAQATAIARVLATPTLAGDLPISLSEEQQQAVGQATRDHFTIITGGPGTGKTAIIVAILRVLVRLGVAPEAIALAGPTGKAAHRMASAIRGALTGLASPDPVDRELLASCPEPRTLHRLLGYSPVSERFRHHENHPIAARAVVVDEASMIDLDLMERLLAAVPAGARLILLGDAEQLPSVAAGAVLRDLVAVLGDNTVQLSHSFRLAGDGGAGILAFATAINRGNCPLPTAAPDDGVGFVDTRSQPARVHAFVDAWCAERIRGDAAVRALMSREFHFTNGVPSAADQAALTTLLHHYERSRLLTITRRFATGSAAVNARIHAQLLADATLTSHPDFYPGEPILMRRNDYERGLFNGDQGLVVRVREDGGRQRFRAVFPRDDGYALFHLDALRAHVDLAFAMTVHKSQGSEFDHVAILLPTSDLPLLTREMLYTAVTRARRSVTLVGSEALIRIAANRTIDRFSGLADKLDAKA